MSTLAKKGAIAGVGRSPRAAQNSSKNCGRNGNKDMKHHLH